MKVSDNSPANQAARIWPKTGWWLAIFLCWPTVREAAGAPVRDENLFLTTNLLRISIEIPPEGVQRLRNSVSGFQRPGLPNFARPEARATIMEGGQIYTNVAVQVKGTSSFQPIDSHPSLTLKFDKYSSGQKFHGLSKISLNNLAQDPTMLQEKLSRDLFASAGLPVTRADHAIVTLNGRVLGIYGLMEGFNREFLARFFTRTDGNFYDPGVLQDIDGAITVTSGKHPNHHAGLERLLAAAREPDPDRRFAALDRALDLDRFVSMLAMEALLCHSDSYSMNRNNYRLYHNPENDKIVFIPHGMDRVLGGHRSGLDLPVVPPMLGLVARAFISTPEGRRRHVERVGVLFTNLFQTGRLTERIREMDSKIAGLGINQHAQYFEDLSQRMSVRALYLKDQLAHPEEIARLPSCLRFGSDNSAAVTCWKPKRIDERPVATCEPAWRDGKQVFHVSLPKGVLRVSLESTVTLPAGRFRVAGKLQAISPSGSPVSVSAGLVRYSARRFGVEFHPLNSQPAGTAITVSTGFAPEEVEFRCDISAPGAADFWFDPSSFQVIRQPD